MADTSIRGRFVWHELMSNDTHAAIRFYSKVAGWTPQVWEQQPSYTMLMTGKSPMGGLMPLPDEAKAGGTPPTWITYIATPDVDGTAMKAPTLGGRVLRQPADIPTIGRFAILADLHRPARRGRPLDEGRAARRPRTAPARRHPDDRTFRHPRRPAGLQVRGVHAAPVAAARSAAGRRRLLMA